MKFEPIETCPKIEGEKVLLYFNDRDVIVSGFWGFVDPEYLDGHKLYDGFYDWFVDDDLFIIDDPDKAPTKWCSLSGVQL